MLVTTDPPIGARWNSLVNKVYESSAYMFAMNDQLKRFEVKTKAATWYPHAEILTFMSNIWRINHQRKPLQT